MGRVDLLAQRDVERHILVRWWPYLLLLAGLVILAFVTYLHNLARRRRWQRYKRHKIELMNRGFIKEEIALLFLEPRTLGCVFS